MGSISPTGKFVIGAFVFAVSATALTLTSMAIHYASHSIVPSGPFKNVFTALNNCKPARDTLFAFSILGVLIGNGFIASSNGRRARRAWNPGYSY